MSSLTEISPRPAKSTKGAGRTNQIDRLWDSADSHVKGMQNGDRRSTSVWKNEVKQANQLDQENRKKPNRHDRERQRRDENRQ